MSRPIHFHELRQIYNDGPWFPCTPTLVAAERAYREAYRAAALEASRWPEPDFEATQAAWAERARVRSQAEIITANGQVIYRVGHDVAAARARGRVQAFEVVNQAWEEWWPSLPDQAIRGLLMDWAEEIQLWAARPIDPERISPPRHPLDDHQEHKEAQSQ